MTHFVKRPEPNTGCVRCFAPVKACCLPKQGISTYTRPGGTGRHKVLALPQTHGKLQTVDVQSYLQAFHTDENRAHMVQPGMVYISHPTEYGALYTKSELGALKKVCKEYGLPLYLDGARPGYGSDVTLRTIAGLCDVFTIGGTKVGALFGEAVVFTKASLIRQPLTHSGETMPLNFTTEELERAVLAAHKAHCQITIHAIGDRGVEAVLDAHEKAQKAYPREDCRHRIEHCMICPPT